MASVEDALFALGITEWVIRGEPTSETQFKAMFRKITSVDSSGRGVESATTSDFGVTCHRLQPSRQNSITPHQWQSYADREMQRLPPQISMLYRT
jgi:hypothetical protein